MSKHSVCGGDISPVCLNGLLNFGRRRYPERTQQFPIIVIQEAGLDGFWIHRVLQKRD